MNLTRGRSAAATAVPSPDLVAAAKLVDAARDVTLVAHVNPDADALGSALALGLVLQRRGATVRVAFAEPARAPESLRSLDVAGLLVAPEEVPTTLELVVALDTACRGRLGTLADRLDAADAVLVIDHHATNERFGTHNLVDVQAEATTVLVLRLLDELGVELDEPVARCLYAGLVTDTSCFRRANGGTHALAARLLAAGVDPEATTRALLDTHPFGWLGMLGAVLSRAELELAAARGLGLVHATIRRADTADLNAEELDSVVDVVRTTAEAEVAAVLKEVAPLEWTVSLRAKRRLDVSAAALTFGGGGHRLAAGFTARGTPEDVLAELRRALDAAPLITR
ncbi:MAG: bifunctional oligoribonuclease/PAP phosphatase NrnA [Actinomycetota bacterium]|nr:bifunctional oligoribonuclease/PAP phosphatase NrnA [Actinomycetota bacterium]